MTGAIFLDRDGVINRKAPEGSYVRDWSEFDFAPGAVQAIAHLARHGRGPLVVVTNQRGIALGHMTQAAVDDIHARLRDVLAAQGVSLGGIQVCPHEIGTCTCRKPDVGLFRAAAREDPAIELDRSAVVGDSLSDLEAGARIGAEVFAVASDPQGLVAQAARSGIQVAGAARSLLELVRSGALDAVPAAPQR